MTTWVSAILAGIQALPKLLELLEKLGQAVKQRELENDLSRLHEAINEFEKVRSLEAAKRAVTRLRDALHKL